MLIETLRAVVSTAQAQEAKRQHRARDQDLLARQFTAAVQVSTNGGGAQQAQPEAARRTKFRHVRTISARAFKVGVHELTGLDCEVVLGYVYAYF